MTSFNRTVMVLGLMFLAGYLAAKGSTNIVEILQAVAAPVAIYIGVKGKGGSS